MQPDNKEKQSWESHILTLDASDTVATGDAIKAGTLIVKVFDSDEADVTTDMIQGTPSFSGTDISVQVKGGTDGGVYNMRVRFETDNGEKIEDDLEIRVVDRP